MSTYSGKLLLRMPILLHGQLSHEARRLDLSLNEICLRKLSTPPHAANQFHLFNLAIETAQRIFQNAIVGAIIVGSYARDELRASSDIDLIFVLPLGVKCQRADLRRWDDAEVRLGSHSVSATFLSWTLEDVPDNVMWLEAAMDGILLFDTHNMIHGKLRHIREKIAAGTLQRKSSHGQPYWIRGVV